MKQAFTLLMKKNLIRLSILFFASTFCNKAWAQQELTLHFMNNLYQSGKTNPAFKPNNEFAFQFLNIYYNYYNSGFRLRDLSNALQETNSADYLSGKMNPVNYIGNTCSSDIFSFRIRAKTIDYSFG